MAYILETASLLGGSTPRSSVGKEHPSTHLDHLDLSIRPILTFSNSQLNVEIQETFHFYGSNSCLVIKNSLHTNFARLRVKYPFKVD